jgi:pilus assembly protein CpaB
MNNKALSLSVLMALVGSFFVYSYVSEKEEQAKRQFGTEVLVLKAKRDIKEQESINETLLELSLIPKKFVEPAAVYFEKREEDKETARSLRGLVGTVAMVPVKKGEQITYNKITEPSIRTGLSPQVAPGKRAVAIPVSETSGVGKLVKPGDRVDLIAIIDMGGGKENRIAKTFLQDVVVLAVGRNVTNNAARVIEADAVNGQPKTRSLTEDFSFSSVTLEVDPVDAQKLALVMAGGENSLSLSLRNNEDTEQNQVQVVTYPDILGPDLAKVRREPAGGMRR